MLLPLTNAAEDETIARLLDGRSSAAAATTTTKKRKRKKKKNRAKRLIPAVPPKARLDPNLTNVLVYDDERLRQCDWERSIETRFDDLPTLPSSSKDTKLPECQLRYLCNSWSFPMAVGCMPENLRWYNYRMNVDVFRWGVDPVDPNSVPIHDQICNEYEITIHGSSETVLDVGGGGGSSSDIPTTVRRYVWFSIDGDIAHKLDLVSMLKKYKIHRQLIEKAFNHVVTRNWSPDNHSDDQLKTFLKSSSADNVSIALTWFFSEMFYQTFRRYVESTGGDDDNNNEQSRKIRQRIDAIEKCIRANQGVMAIEYRLLLTNTDTQTNSAYKQLFMTPGVPRTRERHEPRKRTWQQEQYILMKHYADRLRRDQTFSSANLDQCVIQLCRDHWRMFYELLRRIPNQQHTDDFRLGLFANEQKRCELLRTEDPVAMFTPLPPPPPSSSSNIAFRTGTQKDTLLCNISNRKDNVDQHCTISDSLLTPVFLDLPPPVQSSSSSSLLDPPEPQVYCPPLSPGPVQPIDLLPLSLSASMHKQPEPLPDMLGILEEIDKSLFPTTTTASDRKIPVCRMDKIAFNAMYSASDIECSDPDDDDDDDNDRDGTQNTIHSPSPHRSRTRTEPGEITATTTTTTADFVVDSDGTL